jgi:hypothetical protein
MGEWHDCENSLEWINGLVQGEKSTGNHGFSQHICFFSCRFSLKPIHGLDHSALSLPFSAPAYGKAT